MKLAFIGTGNMGGALARAAAREQGNELLLVNRHPEKAEKLRGEIGGRVTDHAGAVAEADLLFLGVKPVVLQALCETLRPLLRDSAALFTELPPVELLEALGQIPELAGCFRLLPYSDLSGSGLLPVFRPDRLLLDGEETADLLVAVSPNASGEGFEALL